jgi:4-hydroxy-3-polyprenylbenzoate decarboxylase
MPAMRTAPRTLGVAITGASGSIYGVRLLQRAAQHVARIELALSRTAGQVIQHELRIASPCGAGLLAAVGLSDEAAARVRLWEPDDYLSPLASGSSAPDALAIAPCSMGTLGRIVAGVSADLITRAADVALKERRPLLLLVRETPLSLVHLRNMTLATEAGATIFPASPGFYTHPASVDDMVEFVVQRMLDHLGIREERVARWGTGE